MDISQGFPLSPLSIFMFQSCPPSSAISLPPPKQRPHPIAHQPEAQDGTELDHHAEQARNEVRDGSSRPDQHQELQRTTGKSDKGTVMSPLRVKSATIREISWTTVAVVFIRAPDLVNQSHHLLLF